MNSGDLANRPEDESRRALARRCNVTLPRGEMAAQPSLSQAIEHGPVAMLIALRGPRLATRSL